MAMIKVEEVTRSGIAYEIRAWSEGSWCMVQAFRDGQPVGLRYGAGPDERHDIEVVMGLDAVDELIVVAASHVEDDGPSE